MTQKEQEMHRHCVNNLRDHLSAYDPYGVERYFGAERTIPDGPWWVGQHVKLPDTIGNTIEVYPCEFDERGRPIHPWYVGILAAVGVVSGTGKYWHWGPNYTADPVVITKENTPKILLVQRTDNKNWALPGGFIDVGESAEVAAKRETLEETGVVLPNEKPKLIYDGIVADGRTTAHAWAHTSALLWRPDTAEKTIRSEESLAVGWYPLDNLPTKLHGSHQKIIEFALREL